MAADGAMYTSVASACAYCGLPVPKGLYDPLATRQFCCAGCQTVRAAIEAGGLDAYYRVRADTPTAPRPAQPSGRSFAEFDAPQFLQRHARATSSDNCQMLDLYLEGVHCAACVWLVEHGAKTVPGIVDARLDLPHATAQVVFDPAHTKLSELARRLDALGYPAHAARGHEAAVAMAREERRLLLRIGVAWACAGNVMVMALALYAGLFDGMEPQYRALFRWASLLLALPSILWSAQPFFQGAYRALRTGVLHMDLPVALGLLAGFLGGAVNTVRGAGEVWFDSVASLTFLLLVGRWLQLRQRWVALQVTDVLASLVPRTAHRVTATAIEDVPVEALVVGDQVELRAGEPVPVDGAIVDGKARFDLSLLTGETRASEKGRGDTVHAGTTNVSGSVVVQVTATGDQTRAARLAALVQEAAARKAPVAQMADRLVGKFVAVVLSLAAATALLWLWLDPAHALDNTVALLVVTCPCALGLATPLAIHAALGKAAGLGILVKGGDALERLASPAKIVFDKTGTLTQGRLALVLFHGDVALRSWILGFEQASAHPLAQAMRAAWPDVQPELADEVRETPGRGVQGVVQGRDVCLGAPRWVLERSWGDAWRDRVRELGAAGLTPVLLAVDGAVVAALGFGDPVREDAATVISRLRTVGCDIGTQSGDDPLVVRTVARSLGLEPADCEASATPERKLAAVEAMRAKGPVFMVGDGTNDCGALAAATVGIRVHGGSEASLEAADVVLTAPGLLPLVALIEGARRTLHVIRRNIAFSLAWNVLGVALAMAGVLTPLMAAILMPLGSLTVVTLSFKSRTFGRAPCA
jgi:Cu2+-exporting ATPase